MKLKHWKQHLFALNPDITRAMRRSYGTVTATKLADYPIDDRHRRCVVRVVANGDCEKGHEGPTGGCEDNWTGLAVGWLFDNGKRFTAIPVDRKAFRKCHSFDIYKPNPVNRYERVLRPDYESIYEAEYECAAQSADERNGGKHRIKIRNLGNTATIEAERLADYQRNDYNHLAIRQCIVSVKGDGADEIENIKQRKGTMAASDAAYNWLLDKGKRFVGYPIGIGDVSELDAYRDPNDPERMVYRITYFWQDMAMPPFAASTLREPPF